jgi:hypothetical protein
LVRRCASGKEDTVRDEDDQVEGAIQETSREWDDELGRGAPGMTEEPDEAEPKDDRRGDS